MRVLVAGAAGAIGVRLVPRLLARGHQVLATTRRRDKLDQIRDRGAEPILMDGLDAASVNQAVTTTRPDAIIHQMTALSGGANLRNFDKWFAVTNQLRTTGTRHLLAAAETAGVRTFIAQGYTGWTNARTGGPIKTESDPYDAAPARRQTESIGALQFLDRTVPDAPLEGIVLRYGSFYGPGASDELVDLVQKRKMPIIGDGAGIWSWIHVDDAAAATVAALEHGSRGVYNIVDDDPAPVHDWLPYLAQAVGAKPPLRLPSWLGRLAAGEVTVRWMTQARGSSNAKAKKELDWHPVWSTWRTGFRSGLTAPGPASGPEAPSHQ